MTLPKPRTTLALIPLPGNRRLCEETARMLEELKYDFAEAGSVFQHKTCVGYDQAQARDELLAYFLHATDFEDALFIDADMYTDPGHVLRWTAVLREPLVLLPYLMRQTSGMRLEDWALDLAGEAVDSETREGRMMLRVRGAGLGCTRIRRSAVEALYREYGNDRTRRDLNWTSFYPKWSGLPCTGYCTPMVMEHPDGSGVYRRRPEDMSFFRRCTDAGLVPYALPEAVVMHDAMGGVSFWDAYAEHARKHEASLARVREAIPGCPDDLAGLVDVLDGAYAIPGLKFDEPPRVVDVGANVGAFAVYMARAHGFASYDAYEPHPQMAQLCEYALVDLGVAPSRVHRVAVMPSGSVETVKLYDALPTINQGCRSTHPQPGGHADTFTKVLALGAAHLPPCDVLKVDAELPDVAALLEAYPHLGGCTAVLVEWDNVEDYLEIRRVMRAHGFVVMVDRARGNPQKPRRELCFQRADTMGAEQGAVAPLLADEEPRRGARVTLTAGAPCPLCGGDVEDVDAHRCDTAATARAPSNGAAHP